MAEQTTRERVREMTEQGLKPREIALLLGLSTQAIYQHLTKLKQEAEQSS